MKLNHIEVPLKCQTCGQEIQLEMPILMGQPQLPLPKDELHLTFSLDVSSLDKLKSSGCPACHNHDLLPLDVLPGMGPAIRTD